MKKNPQQSNLPESPNTSPQKSKRGKFALPKKIAVPQRFKLRKRQVADAKLVEALQNLPRITNETVAEHREEVLGHARKYIYPLNHSKHRVIVITSGLLGLAIVGFLSYCVIALYKTQSTGTFTYGVTQVIPFPVAKASGSWVSYESYLFELRHTIHYYETQQHEDFNSKSGARHLRELKKQALDQVVQDAYVKQLAKQNKVTISTAEVNDEVALVRSQNRLGSNDQVFRSVLSEFWGWTVKDFERELRQQLLAQKVLAKLNVDADKRAQSAQQALQSGADFAALAKQVSGDQSTKVNGGDYGVAIDKSNRDIAPAVTNALFKLPVGKYSEVINAGYGLEIVKVLAIDGSKVRGAHIVFNFDPIDKYIKPITYKQPAHRYIKI